MYRPDAKRIAFGMATDSKFNRVDDDDRRNEPRAVNQLSAELAGLISSFVKYTMQEMFDELSDMFFRNYKEVGLESCERTSPSKIVVRTYPIHGERFLCNIYGPNSGKYRNLTAVWSHYDKEEMRGEMDLTEIRNVFSAIVSILLTSLPLKMAIDKVKKHFVKKQIEHPHWVVSELPASKREMVFEARNINTYKKIKMRYDTVIPISINRWYHVVTIDGYGPRKCKGHFCEDDVARIIENFEIGIEIDTMKMFTESQLVQWIYAQFPGWSISEDPEDPDPHYLRVHCDYFKTQTEKDGAIGIIVITPECINIDMYITRFFDGIYLPSDVDSKAKPYLIDAHDQIKEYRTQYAATP